MRTLHPITYEYTVAHCMRCARVWAKAPWRYYVDDWIRIARQCGEVDEAEVANILSILAETERRATWLKKIGG